MSSTGATTKATRRLRDCAFVFNKKGGLAFAEDNSSSDEVSVIGGMKVGYPGNHQTRFYVNDLAMHGPHVGLRIIFPVLQNLDYVSFSDCHGKPLKERSITIQLKAGTFVSSGRVLSPEDLARLPPRTSDKNDTLSVLRFTLKANEKAYVENYGMPTVCVSPADQAIFDKDAKIDDAVSLREFCFQRAFEVIIPNFSTRLPAINNQLRTVFPPRFETPYPYTNGEWNPARFEVELKEFARDTPYQPSYKFHRHQDYAVAIAHGVVQDAYHFMKDVMAIRKERVECAFLKVAPDNTKEFRVLVWHHLDLTSRQKGKFGNTLARLLKGDARFGLAFAPPPVDKAKDTDFWRARQISADPWKETGCDFAMEIRRPLGPNNPGNRVARRDIVAFDTYNEFEDGEDVAKARVNAVNPLWEEYAPATDVKVAAKAYEQQIANLIKNDLLAGSGFNTLLHSPAPPTNLTGDDAEVDSITNAPQGMKLVHGQHSLKKVNIDTGNTKNRLWAIVRDGIGEATFERFCEYMKVNRLGVIPLIGFAGSGKTQMSSYVSFLLMQAVGSLYCAAPTHVATSNFAERLFDLGVKAAKELGSNCRAPLVVRGYRINKDLDAFEKIALRFDLSKVADPFVTARWNLRLSVCEWLLKVVGAPGYKLAEIDPEQLHDLRKEFLGKAHYGTLRLWLEGKLDSGFRGQRDGTSDTRSPCEIAEEVMVQIIMRSNAVCSTPHLAGQPPYRLYNRDLAKGVVLDEAGAMHVADALLVWGPGCRPCVLAGDERQLAPTVMTHGEKRQGRIVNVYSNQSKISVLEKLRRSGWPCFILTTQYRVVKGSFDLAQSIIYPDIKGLFEYGETTALGHHPMATKIETWVTMEYNASASPAGTILPLFFHCHGSRCEVDKAMVSRYNEGQNGLVVKLVRGLVGLGVTTSDIVVITPYRANLKRLEMALQAAGCDVAVSTTDSSQGREALVVVLALVVDRTTGPLFVADSHRICVATTRHVGALFVVGDINSARDTKDRVEEAVRSDEGQHLLLNRTAYRKFMQYFKDNRRVVEYFGPGTEPDQPPREASAGAGGAGARGGRGGQGGSRRGRGAGGRAGAGAGRW
ncbi:P-loop containing nucleoside triphosphate hydrolase protein [Chaetomium fimeti]|uniref:P-loop containing nucleoside triphosphate hydrolase protein n=1 Tax=Chaetomium fimeti TaxID=1854472 RepID=A0AAE0HDF0_9PEZI|nr:P-loop containing nucleoside triphosphate hydrolase protein [Chaetomium fimeti]